MKTSLHVFACLLFLACSDGGAAGGSPGDGDDDDHQTDEDPAQAQPDGGMSSAPESDLGQRCTSTCAAESDCLDLRQTGGFCSPRCDHDSDCAFAGPGTGACILASSASDVKHCGIRCAAGGVCPDGFACNSDFDPALCLPSEPSEHDPVDDPPDAPINTSAAACNGSGRLRRLTQTDIFVEEFDLRTVWTLENQSDRKQHVVRGFTRKLIDDAWSIPNGEPDELMVVLTLSEFPDSPLRVGWEAEGIVEVMRWDGCEWYRYLDPIYPTVTIGGYEVDVNDPQAWCRGTLTGVAHGDGGGFSNERIELYFDAPLATANFTNGKPVEEACPCQPMCEGRVCGDDGCGGSCGDCGDGLGCTGAGQCECIPECDGKNCGDNGCGGDCGSCPITHVCSDAGRCECTPECDGRRCGDDGCGGQCGRCQVGELCSAGACEKDPDYCDPVSNSGCEPPNQCLLLSSERTVCAAGGSGGQGSSCSSVDPCRGGYACFAGTCQRICNLPSGACPAGSQCTPVAGWFQHGACREP